MPVMSVEEQQEARASVKVGDRVRVLGSGPQGVLVEVTPDDAVNHPTHYTSGPKCECGRVIECITVIRDRRLSIGNAIKYLWRNGLKRDADKSTTEKQIEDLRKAVWFIEDEIAQLERATSTDEKGARDGAR